MTRSRMIAIALAVLVGAIAVTAYTYRSRFLAWRSATTSVSTPEPNGGSPAGTGDTPRAPIEIDPRRQQLIGVRTVAATRQPLSGTIRATGVVRYDETRQTDVNVKIEGWIRDLYVDYTGQAVRQGQPLFTLYSPQVVAAEREYLLALKNRDEMQHSPAADALGRADQIVTAARQRLALWDVPAEQMAALDRDREAPQVVTVAAPASGFIVEKQAIQGMHVMPGQTLYKMGDVSVVWVEADLYESDIALVRAGQTATVRLDAYPGEQFTGRVVYIYPYVDPATRTNKVRYAFANRAGKLKPGMYASVEMSGAPGDALVVPTNAVLDSGKEQIVFVAQGEGRFEPRHVTVGRRAGEQVEILAGVKDGEQVATSAAFFLDSESQLRGSLDSYTSAPAASGAAAIPEALTITFHTMPDPPKAGDNQFEVTVKDASGKNIDDAQVSVQFFMAAMPTMNMPAMRSLATLSGAGAGVYRGRGQILTSGRWDTTINVTRNGQRIGGTQLTVATR
jgi:RND family efflux transporter MFP subunit